MRNRIKSGFALAVCALVVQIPNSAWAAENESISAFHVDVEIDSKGLIHIVESIDYDFANANKHGILRDIPEYVNLPDNRRQNYGITVNEVTMDGSTVPYSEDHLNGYLELRIGDPDKEVTGTHLYLVDYVVSNGLNVITQPVSGLSIGDVDFYWNLIGHQWQVNIDNASASITLPSAPKQVSCTYGPFGSLSACPFEISGNKVSLEAPDTLWISHALTAAIQVDAQSFETDVTPTIVDQPATWQDQFLDVFPYGLLAFFVTFFAIIIRAIVKRRTAKTVAMTAAIQFEPPGNLKPAQIAAAWHGKIDTRAFTATLLDLAARGSLAISLREKKQLVIRHGMQLEKMSTWERQLTDVILGDHDEVILDKYRVDVDKEVESIGRALKDAAIESGIRNPQSFSARRGFLWATITSGLALAASAFTSGIPQVFVFTFFISAAAFLASLISIWIMPTVQTKSSAGFLSEVAGFKKLLSTDAAKARTEFAQRSGLAPAAIFATMLPYAVLYGIDKSWCAAFPDLTPAQLSTFGLGFASSGDLHQGLTTVTNSLAASMTSPSSSGSGGSGGSSGAGGGGGGGGSW